MMGPLGFLPSVLGRVARVAERSATPDPCVPLRSSSRASIPSVGQRLVSARDGSLWLANIREADGGSSRRIRSSTLILTRAGFVWRVRGRVRSLG